MNSIDNLCINTIRFLSADAVEKAKSGHPGTPMALAPLTYVLWTKFLKHNPRNTLWADRDRFILSAGHASMLLYSLLHLTGYDLSLEDIRNFRQYGSKTPGHPEYGITPGAETTTGPLGQGFGNGVGMAIAERMLAARFNRPGLEIVNHYTYAVASDGDLMEGVSHEAASIAGHLGLGKLIYFYDDNKITIDGHTDLAFSENVKMRFESYGWHVETVENGNEDLDGIERAVKKGQAEKNKPTLVIIKTIIAYGSPNKKNTHGAHGSPLGEDEIRLTKRALEWPTEEAFFIPQDALAHFRKSVEKGAAAEKQWNELFQRYEREFPDLAAEWKRCQTGGLPAGWEKSLPVFKPEEPAAATRVASGKVLNAIAAKVPNLVGGSADLHPSTNTYLNGFGSFSREHPEARNLHYGIREHGMGSITNGIALHGGLIPLCSTFLIFSDYMRPTIRLAALMGIRSIFVFTHDSIGLGEDGPTHQPIEHLAALRAIPNLVVFRPADANETRGAWRAALERKDGPSLFALSRQNLPNLKEAADRPDENVRHGAYILQEGSKGKPEAILMATGSEVSIAVKARELLEAKGVSTRVVSMPSWELFRAQPQSYRSQVFPPDVTARVSIEAGVAQGWREFTGPGGVSVSLERFGESAPAKTIYEKLGLTPENAAAKALEVLRAAGKKV